MAQSPRNDVLGDEVRQAIATLRARNIIVLIVTGRILSELERVAGSLHFVDAVVAENGAVIYVPDSRYTQLLGEPPPAALLEAALAEGSTSRRGNRL